VFVCVKEEVSGSYWASPPTSFSHSISEVACIVGVLLLEAPHNCCKALDHTLNRAYQIMTHPNLFCDQTLLYYWVH